MPRKVAKRKGTARRTGKLKKTAPPRKRRAKPELKGKGAPKELIEGLTSRHQFPKELVSVIDEVYRSIRVPKKGKRIR